MPHSHPAPAFMRPLLRSVLPLLSVAALSGCGMAVHKLHDLNPPANDFNSSLASEYRDYADSEYEQGRSSIASHFANKGLDALDGKTVEPDAVNNSLPEAQQHALTEGRAQLEKFLTEDIKHVAPQKLAHGQMLFDCWQNELLKDISQQKAPCGEEFHSTLAELQKVSDALHFSKETNHVITFAHKSTRLNAEGLKTIQNIADQVADMPHYRVLLMVYMGHGHAQHHLTEARLNAVRHALVKAGVLERHIRVEKEGGAKAVILSRDNIRVDAKKITIVVKTQNKPKD